MPKFGEFFFGQSDRLKKKQAFSNEQMGFFNQLLQALSGGQGGQGQGMGGQRQRMGGMGGQGQGGMGGGGFLDYFQNLLNPNGGQGDFENFAAPYRQQFEEETIPMLSERFAGMGGGMGGALSSSGFGQALGGAGRGFNADLAQLFASLRQNAAGQMAGLSQSALGAQPFAFSHRPASPGLVQTGLGSFMQGLGGGARGGL